MTPEPDQIKPTNCTCRWPVAIERNMCGHATDCPCYTEWAMATFLTKDHFISEDCASCDNYFKHASFPAAHIVKLSARDGEHPSNPDGAEPIDCWKKHAGRIHCEITSDQGHALRVNYVCHGCGWYMQERITSYQHVEGGIKLIFREDRDPIVQIRIPTPMPWNAPGLQGWSIVGMNHYFIEGPKKPRRLFVAMVDRTGRCIKAEGSDEESVFQHLAMKATAAALPGGCKHPEELRKRMLGIGLVCGQCAGVVASEIK